MGKNLTPEQRRHRQAMRERSFEDRQRIAEGKAPTQRTAAGYSPPPKPDPWADIPDWAKPGYVSPEDAQRIAEAKAYANKRTEDPFLARRRRTTRPSTFNAQKARGITPPHEKY